MKDLEPFLYLPFKPQEYRITEGWRYSKEEKAIHGLASHGAIDFDLPRGTEVLAAADGFAVASYLFFPIKDENGNPRLYQGKQVGFGFGRYVQIYHPENGLYTAYGHLEKVSPKLRFHQPVKKGERWWPVGHKVSPEKLAEYPFATRVKAGDVIGFVGDSGLTWGYSDFPQRPDPQKFPSWDTTHLHFEVFERYGSRKKKKYYDPFGIKGSAENYPDSFKHGKPLGEKSQVLWILDDQGRPIFFN